MVTDKGKGKLKSAKLNLGIIVAKIAIFPKVIKNNKGLIKIKFLQIVDAGERRYVYYLKQ